MATVVSIRLSNLLFSPSCPHRLCIDFADQGPSCARADETIQNSPNKPPFPPLPIQPQPQPKTEGRTQPNDHSSISPHPHPQPANVIHPLPSSGRTDHATRKEGKKYSVDPWLGVIRPVPRHSSACARRRTNERTHPAAAYDRATIYSAHRPRKATPT